MSTILHDDALSPDGEMRQPHLQIIHPGPLIVFEISIAESFFETRVGVPARGQHDRGLSLMLPAARACSALVWIASSSLALAFTDFD